MKSLAALALALIATSVWGGGMTSGDGDRGREAGKEHSQRRGGDHGHGQQHRHDHRHQHLLRHFGGTIFIGPIYRGPYVHTPYVFAPILSLPSPPPAYVEQAAPPLVTPSVNYWYYCERIDTYYPYAKECPDGWKTVAPPPPN